MSQDHQIAGWLAGLESWVAAQPDLRCAEALGGIELLVGDSPGLRIQFATERAVGKVATFKVSDPQTLISLFQGEVGWQEAFLKERVVFNGEPTALTALSVLLSRYANELRSGFTGRE